jgi:hypothetical protein
MMTVIAHYKLLKVWMRILGAALVLLCILFFCIWMLRSHTGINVAAAVVLIFNLLIFSFWLSIFILRSFRLVVFHDARLIWIEGKSVIWKSESVFSVACANIVQVSEGVAGQFAQFDKITFRMRDGSEKIILTDMLSEPCERVVERLNEALGLRK